MTLHDGSGVTTGPASVTPPGPRETRYICMAGAGLLGVGYMFSPLISFAGALLYLVMLSHWLDRPSRITASAIAILSGASIWASREVGHALSDDFVWYYDLYDRIDTGAPWTGGRVPVYEAALPLVLKIVAVAVPRLTPNGLMFVLTSLTGLILLLCLERYGLAEFSPEKRGYCLGMVFVAFSFLQTTQLTRQMLSSVLVATALFPIAAITKRVALVLAAAFHISAVIVYIVLSAFRGSRLLLVCMLVATGILALAFDAERAASWVTAYDVPRVGAYFMSAEDASNRAGFAILLLVAGAGLLSLLVLKGARARIVGLEKQALVFLLSMILIYAFTLDLVLGPFRLFLVLHSVMAGWFFAYFTRRLPHPYLVIGSVVLVVWQIGTFYLRDPMRTFELWEMYEPFGAVPGYFALSYLAY